MVLVPRCVWCGKTRVIICFARSFRFEVRLVWQSNGNWSGSSVGGFLVRGAFVVVLRVIYTIVGIDQLN